MWKPILRGEDEYWKLRCLAVAVGGNIVFLVVVGGSIAGWVCVDMKMIKQC